MKPQHIIFSLTMFFFAGTAFAQETSDNPEVDPSVTEINLIKFGAKGGLNFSNLYFNNTYHTMKLGGHAGIYAELPISSHFAFQPEILFSQKGAEYNVNNTHVDARLNYFDLPLLLEYKPTAKLALQLGPQFSYLADANLDCSKVIPEGGEEKYEICDSYNFNSFDYGFAAGIEYQLIKGHEIGVRYNHGFMPLENNKDLVVNGYTPEKTGANNSVLQFFITIPVN